jgi:hypothetical protein
MAQVWKWDALYEWDKKYRAVRAELAAPWNTDFPWLMMYLREEDRLSKSKRPRSDDAASKSEKSERTNSSDTKRARSETGSGVCWAYNRAGGCSYGSKCIYNHVCENVKCRGKHSKLKCPNGAAAATVASPPK